MGRILDQRCLLGKHSSIAPRVPAQHTIHVVHAWFRSHFSCDDDSKDGTADDDENIGDIANSPGHISMDGKLN